MMNEISKENPVVESLAESSDIVSGERTGNFRPVDQFLSDMHEKIGNDRLFLHATGTHRDCGLEK